MFDDDESDGFMSFSDDDLDDFDYYCSFIKALEEEFVSKSEIVTQLMDEFDLEKGAAVKVLKRYLAEKDDFDDEEEADDFCEDDDYSDGNSER